MLQLITTSHWKWPQIEGLHGFKGQLCHTAKYDPKTDLDNKRVAVIGTGSSGVQVIPTIVSKVKELHTWIRTPTWITPGFAQKYAGPNGQNFACKRPLPLTVPIVKCSLRYGRPKETMARESSRVPGILQEHRKRDESTFQIHLERITRRRASQNCT